MSEQKEGQKKAIMQIGTTRAGALRPRNLPELVEFAEIIAHSSMVPKNYQGSPGDIIVAIQMGGELGLAPLQALQNIAVINGRPCLWGDAMLGLIQAHPECEDVIEELDTKTKVATCTVKRRGRSPVVRTFSWDDAKTAGLHEKQGPWKQYPKRMLQMRARGFALRDAFPDVLRGINLAEEQQDVIDVQPQWVDTRDDGPAEGVHKFGGRNGGRGHPAKAKAPDPKPEPEPAAEANAEPASEPEERSEWDAVGPPPMTEEEQAEATGQQKLGW